MTPLRVLVLYNNPAQASFRVRIEALRPHMASRGINWEPMQLPRSLFGRRQGARRASQYDAVVLQRKLLDPSVARVLRRSARRVIFDVDDAIMFPDRPTDWFSRWRLRRRFIGTCAVLSHAAVGNAYLAEIFKDQGVPATVVPTVLDPARYPPRQHAPTAAPRLVWIGGDATLPYLQKILPQLGEAARQVPGLRLLTIGNRTVSEAPLPVDHEPWTAEGEAAALARGDIGLAPTPDTPWTRGKCGFKILQYMAAALPAVASPVGANAEIIVPEETGLLPARADEWPAAIVRLARDAELRQRLGEAGRRRVESHYSLERSADLWEQLLRNM